MDAFRPTIPGWAAALAVAAALGFGAAAPAGADDAATSLTNAADNARTGWYPDEPGLDPGTVAGSTFGQLFSAPVDGQVYAQPLVADDTLLVATQANQVYGLDPATGTQRWTRDLGPAWNVSVEVHCGDIYPTEGVTATPVVDAATGTAYLTSKTYEAGTSGAGAWYLHALDVSTGDERAGFPVKLEGSAQNAPGVDFDATQELQRPGLLLLDGVVYAAFGGQCDQEPYRGWVIGVSTSGQVKARWTDVADPEVSGAGIWQSGGGLASDGPDQILLTTGNNASPPFGATGSSSPSQFGDSMVRLHVQPDGSLLPTDFFTPYDATELDTRNSDFGSGGPVALPAAPFGTPSHPHLAVAEGKEGYVYLLDRDDLGGRGTGTGGGDRVVQRTGPFGGVWSRPAVWPGDGGYVYMPTGSPGGVFTEDGGALQVYRYGVDGAGNPSLALAGTSTDTFGFSSGAPVVTSDGTASGSALVWLVWSSGGPGDGAQLRAYDAVPADGHPVLRFTAPVGVGAKFAPPGVSGNRVYVGTRDGHVLAFGSPVDPTLTGSPLRFGSTVLGDTSEQTETLTAARDLTVTSLSSSNPGFTIGTPSPPVGTSLSAGDQVQVPVTFAPGTTGPVAGSLVAETSAGRASVAISGRGLSPDAKLDASPPVVSFGGAPVGRGSLTGSVTFSNLGAKPLTIESLQLPSASGPFSASGTPAPGDTLGPGDSINVSVTFAPTGPGQFSDQIGLTTTGGEKDVGLSASASPAGHLEITPEQVDFGAVDVGGSATSSFTIANTGGSPVTITKSKPPVAGAFVATSRLDEGSSVPAGGSVTETVRFAPGAPGPASDRWVIGGDDDSGAHSVTLTGSGGGGSGPAPAPATDLAGDGSGLAALAPRSAPAPRLLSLTMSTHRLRTAGFRRRGTDSADVRYRLSGPGRVRFSVEREHAGVWLDRSCRARVSRARGARPCVWYERLAGAIVRSASGGAGRLTFTGWIGGRALTAGAYRLVATATDSARGGSGTRSVRFLVVG
jgi:outer membrane protein assembly factor BamB